MDDNQPKGIGFFNIKSGETHYLRLEPQIQAYINSSDMGINASRDQDFGWRLEPEWVNKVRDFRRDETKMERLVSRNGGQKVTTTQILYAIYGEQLRVAEERAEEQGSPFEEEYLQQIAAKPTKTRKVNRDAGDGQFVSDEEVKDHPDTTVTETVKSPSKK